MRRAEAAAGTRRAILAAALELFREEGYRHATLVKIAARASVSVNAVYSSVGAKPQLLVQLVAEVTADPTIRAAVDALDDFASGSAILRALANGTRRVLEQHDWLLSELYDNAASDGQIYEAIVVAEAAYSRRVALVGARLAERGVLRRDITGDRATAMLRFHFSYSPWRELRNAGWTWPDAEEWLLDQAGHALIDPEDSITRCEPG